MSAIRSKYAVVTGASGGIGAEICRTLAQDGFAIIAQYCGGEARATELRRTIKASGGECHLTQADLSTTDGVVRVVECVRALVDGSTNTLDALVNNAGKLLGPSFGDATPEQFDEFFAINTRAPFFLSQSLAPLLREGGSIVNISSASAHFSSPGDIIYAMTKAAIESLTRNMAEAIAERGLRVNAVVPGFTDNGHPAFSQKEVRDYMDSFAVLGGVASPSDVASTVAFLVSRGASRITGSVLDVSGGSTLGARGSRAHSVRDLF